GHGPEQACLLGGTAAHAGRVRGFLGAEVGGSPANRGETTRPERDEGLPQLDPREYRRKQAARSIRAGTRGGAREHLPESAGELVPREPRSGAARGEYGASLPRHAAQLRAMPQSSLRKVDAG